MTFTEELDNMIIYYNRQGQSMGRAEAYARLSDPEYKRVGATQVGKYWVSTVWLGIDHSFLEGPPIIFETMVFEVKISDGPQTLGSELYCDRYSTEQEAIEGHNKAILKYEHQLEKDRAKEKYLRRYRRGKP